jgi:hypothetical protein
VLDLHEGDRVLFYTDGLQDLAITEPATPESIASALREIGQDPQALEKLLAHITDGRERTDRDDVTLVLLEFTAGANRLNGKGEFIALAKAPERPAPEISHAETDSATFFFFEGRITWMFGQTLFDTVVPVIDGGRDVVLDFTDCTHLDSTLLGTLHELVIRAEEAGVSLHLQWVSPDLLEAFEELSLNQVIARVLDTPRPSPGARTRLPLTDVSQERQRARLLKAHEVLAELNAANRADLDNLINTLRSESPPS